MVGAFHQPRGFRQALRLKARFMANGLPVAGGTDLLVKMRAGRTAPTALIDLSLAGVGYIRRGGEWLRLGAAATAGDFLRLSWAERQAPALWKACLQLGGPQIQNAATFAGNLANASPAADTPPVLLVMDAQVGIESVDRGLRWVPIDEFFLSPGKSVLQPDELIREIRIPRSSLSALRSRKSGDNGPWILCDFYKMGPRRAQVISVCCVAGWAVVESGAGNGNPGGVRVLDLRLAAGGVAPRPVRLKAVEEFIRGKGLTPDLAREAAPFVREQIAPIGDVRGSAEYKALLARRFTQTFLESLIPDGCNEEAST